MKKRRQRRDKHKRKWLLPAAISAIFLCIILCIIWPRQTVLRIPYVNAALHYLDEIINNPKIPSATFYGLDVSSHQGKINWNDVAINYDIVSRRLAKEKSTVSRNIDFAIAKATEGKTFTDAYLADNRVGIRNAGIIYGAYHFFSLKSSPEDQAQHFISQCGLQRGDMVPVLDFEVDDGLNDNELRQRVLTWLHIVGKHFNCKPMIYTSANYRLSLFATSEFDDYGFWIAHYGVDSPKCNCAIWQFTENGIASGIDGRVDMNAFFRNSSDFLQLILR